MSVEVKSEARKDGVKTYAYLHSANTMRIETVYYRGNPDKPNSENFRTVRLYGRDEHGNMLDVTVYLNDCDIDLHREVVDCTL